jgi:hypothetical protein
MSNGFGRPWAFRRDGIDLVPKGNPVDSLSSVNDTLIAGSCVQLLRSSTANVGINPIKLVSNANR